MKTNSENEYDIDTLKVNRYLKASFKASEFYEKSKNIQKDYEAFIKSTKTTKITKEEEK